MPGSARRRLLTAVVTAPPAVDLSNLRANSAIAAEAGTKGGIVLKIRLDKQTDTITDKESEISIHLVEIRPERETVFEANIRGDIVRFSAYHDFGEWKIKDISSISVRDLMNKMKEMDEINVNISLFDIKSSNYDDEGIKDIINIISKLLLFRFRTIKGNVFVKVHPVNLDRSCWVSLP